MDFLDIPALKDLAKVKYEALVVMGWNDPAFAESIRLLSLNTWEKDRDIKDIAIKTAQKSVKALLDRVKFRTLLKDIGEVAFHILHSAFHDKADLAEPYRSRRKARITTMALRSLTPHDAIVQVVTMTWTKVRIPALTVTRTISWKYEAQSLLRS